MIALATNNIRDKGPSIVLFSSVFGLSVIDENNIKKGLNQ
jgi:hypothetical protein